MVGGSLIETFKEVPVGVKRGLDRRVTEPSLDDFRMFTHCDEKRGMCMSEIVKGARLPDRRLDCRKPYPSPEARTSDRATRPVP